MTYRAIFSLLPILLPIIILAAAGEVVAAQEKSSTDDKKQPQWLVGYDGVSVLIPGIGRITLPPYDKGSSGQHSGSYGSIPASSGQYIPGGDDNFIPNPGFEVPNPANIGGSVKATRHP